MGKPDMDLTATLINEDGTELTYRPYAYMAYEGEHFVVMRAVNNNSLQDDILILKAEVGNGKAVFNLVEQDSALRQTLYKGLGMDSETLN